MSEPRRTRRIRQAHVPSIDNNIGRVDVGACRAGHEKRREPDVVRLAPAAQRNKVLDVLPRERSAEHPASWPTLRPSDGTGRDADNADVVVAGELHAEGPGEHIDACLGGRGVRLERHGLVLERGSDVDHDCAVGGGLGQARKARLAHVESALVDVCMRVRVRA